MRRCVLDVIHIVSVRFQAKQVFIEPVGEAQTVLPHVGPAVGLTFLHHKLCLRTRVLRRLHEALGLLDGYQLVRELREEGAGHRRESEARGEGRSGSRLGRHGQRYEELRRLV